MNKLIDDSDLLTDIPDFTANTFQTPPLRETDEPEDPLKSEILELIKLTALNEETKIDVSDSPLGSKGAGYLAQALRSSPLRDTL